MRKRRLDQEQECEVLQNIGNPGLDLFARPDVETVDERNRPALSDCVMELLRHLQRIRPLVTNEHTALTVFDAEFLKDKTSRVVVAGRIAQDEGVVSQKAVRDRFLEILKLVDDRHNETMKAQRQRKLQSAVVIGRSFRRPEAEREFRADLS